MGFRIRILIEQMKTVKSCDYLCLLNKVKKMCISLPFKNCMFLLP